MIRGARTSDWRRRLRAMRSLGVSDAEVSAASGLTKTTVYRIRTGAVARSRESALDALDESAAPLAALVRGKIKTDKEM